MQKTSKRQRLAALHREIILESARDLFLQRGYDAVSLDDLCQASSYSRRTIYKYFQSKEDIYLHLIYQGLAALDKALITALHSTPYFLARYRAVCAAMRAYHDQHPHSFQAVNQYAPESNNPADLLPVVRDIFSLGETINQRLTDYIKEGIEQGIVLDTVQPRQSAYVIWAGISSLLEMTKQKSPHLEAQFGMPADDFLQYGFDQIIDGILEDRIHGSA